MAKKKSITAADAAKLRDIDTYTHDDKNVKRTRSNGKLWMTGSKPSMLRMSLVLGAVMCRSTSVI
ncbi:hypothetical protein [Fibrobacter sp.]|uniref:hypothetical protein n=1 Tax=Fibrobacter sp. TaxID=35828 RepID=UPI00388FB55E